MFRREYHILHIFIAIYYSICYNKKPVVRIFIMKRLIVAVVALMALSFCTTYNVFACESLENDCTEAGDT